MLNSSNSSDSDEFKVSNRLILKIQLGDDIRKIILHNDDFTFDELSLMIFRVFQGKISNKDEIKIKYLDDENDKITLTDDSDLKLALLFRQELRLFVSLSDDQTNKKQIMKNQTDPGFIKAETFKNQLQIIRDSIQAILDKLPIEIEKNTQIPSCAIQTLPETPSTFVFQADTVREFDQFQTETNQNQKSNTTNQQNVFHQTKSESNQTVEMSNPFSLSRSNSLLNRYPTVKSNSIFPPTNSSSFAQNQRPMATFPTGQTSTTRVIGRTTTDTTFNSSGYQPSASPSFNNVLQPNNSFHGGASNQNNFYALQNKK